MRHYFGYNSDGTLVSCWTAQNGHPPEFDLHNPNSDQPRVQLAYAEHQKKHKNFAGFVGFDCPCPPNTGNFCECAFPKYAASYVKSGALLPKASASFLLDDQPQPSLALGQSVDRAPGSKIVLTVVCQALADGEIVKLAPWNHGAAVHAGFPAQVPLTMKGGVSETTMIVAPAQGMTGGFCVKHDRVAAGSLWIRGFAT
jgi:hypothetical protein